MAKMNKIKLWINDIEYTEYVDYPISITDKNLEESLNIISLTLKHTNISEIFNPFLKSRIKLYSGDGLLVDEFKYILLSDRATKLGYNNLYNHSLTFIETTHLLSTIPVPNMTITRAVDEYEPTLKDVVQRVINEAHRFVDYNFIISAETGALLDSYISPEWTFTNRNFIEILRMIFSMVKIIPFMEWPDSGINYSIKHMSLSTEITTELNDFYLKEGTYDPRTYTASLYSGVKNFLAGEDKPIVEPANGWLTVKSPDSVRINADSMEIRTKYPIYKILHIEMPKTLSIVFDDNGDGVGHAWEVPAGTIPDYYYKLIEDRPPCVFEKDYWDSLENTEDYGERGGSFYYKQGTNKIQNLQYIAPTWSQFLDPNMQAWKVVLRNFYIMTLHPLSYWIKDEYLADAELLIKNAIIVDPYHDDLSIEDIDILQAREEGVYNINWNFWEFQIRITYIPLIDTDLFSYKETLLEDRYRTYRPYNQQANVISNEVLGELHEKVLRRGNEDSMTISTLYDDYAAIAAAGERVGDYIISTREVEVNLYTTKVNYTLSKFFAILKKHAAILEEYRQYLIPNENIVRSQRTFHNFIKINFSGDPIYTNTKFSTELYHSNKELNLMRWNFYNSLAIPLISYNFNNTLVFESHFENNVLAGYKLSLLEVGGIFTEPQAKDVPVKYTDSNGRITIAGYIRLGRNFGTITEITDVSQANVHTATMARLPEYYGNLEDTFYADSHSISKDAREQLVISFQFHHVVENQDIYLNEGFSRENGLIGGKGLNSMKIAFLYGIPRNKKYLLPTDIIQTNTSPFTYNVATNSIQILPKLNVSTDAAAWAIIDPDTLEVLLWVDRPVDAGTANEILNIYIDTEY